ncbi:MAG: cytochrome P450 [Nevskiaceae bacterium]|nr:MAG: cytochrome P450 [Nevskiaceae bacterium]TBR71770.1 MAG: cytochrome P450 [Nevskiaceae bacterium]
MRTKIPVELIEPAFNPATFGIGRREAIDNLFRRLRKDYPLGLAEVPGYDPHWIVTKYNDIREVTSHDSVFHSADRSKTLASQIAEKLMRDYTGGLPTIFKTLVHMDDPEHAKHRAVTQARFYPQVIAKLEPWVREKARRYIDEFIEKGPGTDFATELAFPYPAEVVLSILGFPREDHTKLLDLTHWLFCYADPDLCRPGANITDPQEIIRTWDIVYNEFKDYFLPRVLARRKCPMDDLTSVIANGEVDGCPINERNLVSYLVILATAGHDSSAATTAMTMWTMAENPALFHRIKENPQLLPGFVEESIRWASPVQQFVRSATQDYTLRGQDIKKGELVYLSYVSGNRDEEAFKDPFTFDPERKPNRHLAFSYGPHICLGQHLARLEMRVLWEELLPRLESVEMAAPGKFTESEFVCGPKSVPINFKLAKQVERAVA